MPPENFGSADQASVIRVPVFATDSRLPEIDCLIQNEKEAVIWSVIISNLEEVNSVSLSTAQVQDTGTHVKALLLA